MKHLWLIWSNPKRRKLRTGFTIAAIAVAFLLFVLLIAAKATFTAGVSIAGQNWLIVQHKVSFIMSMPISYLQRSRPCRAWQP
jgi:putative ABC transport system permease protein